MCMCDCAGYTIVPTLDAASYCSRLYVYSSTYRIHTVAYIQHVLPVAIGLYPYRILPMVDTHSSRWRYMYVVVVGLQ